MCILCDRLKDGQEAFSNNFDEFSEIASKFRPEYVEYLGAFVKDRLMKQLRNGELDSGISGADIVNLYLEELKLVTSALAK